MTATPYTGPRVETWRWQMLGVDESPKGVLDGAGGGSASWSIFDTIRGKGTLEFAGKSMPDWSQLRLQPWYVADTPMGHVEWPLGVFLPSTPAVSHTPTGLTATVNLYDKLLLVDRDAVNQTFTAPTGSIVTSVVRSLLPSGSSIMDSAEFLNGPMSWPAGTSKLRIVNDLLASINYFSLSCDGRGMFTAKGYVPPLARDFAYTFRDSTEGIYDPTWDRELDTFDVPNEVILLSRTDGETAPVLRGYAANTDPASPTSYPSRGNQWVSVTETDVEATSQAVIDQLAMRRLVDLSQKSAKLTLPHAVVPLQLNDAVVFQSDRDDVEAYCVVQSMAMNFAPGAGMVTELLEVVL